jgi:phosphopantothenoylcysteine decarboxylase
MNTLMYNHPLTSEHLRVVKEVIGYHVVGPIGKTLACGDVGKDHPHFTEALLSPVEGLGAMTEWKDIVQIVAGRFSLQKPAVEHAGS